MKLSLLCLALAVITANLVSCAMIPQSRSLLEPIRKNECKNYVGDFPSRLLTIGPYAGGLIMVTKNLRIYELASTDLDQQHLHLYNSAPVSINSKWPHLSKDVRFMKMVVEMQSDGVGNVFVTKFSPFENVLNWAIMFATTKDDNLTTLTYNFNSTKIFTKFSAANLSEVTDGLWMSSDEDLETFYSLYENGTRIARITNAIFNNEELITLDLDIARFSVCDVTPPGRDGLFVVISNGTCTRPIEWTVSKGVRHSDWFYLFGPNHTLIFNSKQAFAGVPSPVAKLPHRQFILCSKAKSSIERSVVTFQPVESSLMIAVIVVGILTLVMSIVFIVLLSLCIMQLKVDSKIAKRRQTQFSSSKIIAKKLQETILKDDESYY